MQKDNKFFDDFARLASGAAGGFMDMKREVDAAVSAQVEKFMQKLNLVTKEELDTVQGMLAKARQEQDDLRKRIETLENNLAKGEK